MKKFVAPLQAFAALFICSGMAWMVFVLSSIDPKPPTAMDLQARNTQDLSFANMNSTAVALAKEMLAGMVPTPSVSIFLPVTGRETATQVPSAIVTLKPVNTTVITPTHFSNIVSPTATRKKQERPPSTATETPAPTNTLPAPTVIPSQTKPPSPTPLPTSTPTDVPTEPPTMAPTATPVSPPSPATVPPTEVTTGPPPSPPASPGPPATAIPTIPVVVTSALSTQATP